MSQALFTQLLALVATMIVALLALFVAVRINYFNWQKQGEFAHLGFGDVIGAFAIMFVVQLLIAPFIYGGAYALYSILSLGVPIDPKSIELSQSHQAAFAIFSNLILLGALLIYGWVKKGKVKTFFGNRFQIRDFFIGSLSWLVCTPLAAVFNGAIDLLVGTFRDQPIDQVAVQHVKQTLSSPLLFAMTAILVVFIIPIIEELLFRGFLQTWLRQYLGVKPSILVCSIIFTLFHFSKEQGIDNLVILTTLFIVSCFMGYVYERQKNLLASIGLHATFNAVSTLGILLVHATA
ncbi:MAG: lysostaphin resistance A-like protein [Parachlamydiaceae bacterium]